MKATHVRTIVKDENGVVIFRGEWRRISLEMVHCLKKEVSKRRAAENNGRTHHLVYSHPVSDKQRKALEHGQRMQSIKGAAGLIRNVQTKYAKELNLAAPNSNYRLQLVVSLLEEIARDLKRKGPL